MTQQPHANYLRDQLAAATNDLASRNDPNPEPELVEAGDNDQDQDDTGGDSAEEDRAQRAKRKKRRYDKMARIEGRVTDAQLRRLDQLRADLMKRRTRTGDRITNNTLLRVAVEGLLSCRRELHGDDEDELQAAFLEFLDRARERS